MDLEPGFSNGGKMDLRPMYTETKVSGEGLGCSATSIASGNSITEFCLTNEKSKIRPCFRHSTSAVQNEVDWCVGIKVSPGGLMTLQ